MIDGDKCGEESRKKAPKKNFVLISFNPTLLPPPPRKLYSMQYTLWAWCIIYLLPNLKTNEIFNFWLLLLVFLLSSLCRHRENVAKIMTCLMFITIKFSRSNKWELLCLCVLYVYSHKHTIFTQPWNANVLTCSQKYFRIDTLLCG